MRMRTSVSSPVIWMAIVVIAVAVPAGAQNPYWQATGDDIVNTNSGRVVVGALASGSSASLQVGDETWPAIRLHQVGQSTNWLDIGIAIGANWYSALAEAGDSVVKAKHNLILTSASDGGSVQFGIGQQGSHERVFALFDRSAGSRVSAYDNDDNEIFSVLNDGTTKVKILEITGGADLAEPFEVRHPDVLAPGTVVSIDPAHPGAVSASTTAYDRRVAGVVSGGGDISTGLVMGSTVVNGASKSVLLALAGRVWVKADTSNGPIQPGDLLTSSGQAGRAMRASDLGRAQGAVIGKAMTALEAGDGEVLVLVWPQ